MWVQVTVTVTSLRLHSSSKIKNWLAGGEDLEAMAAAGKELSAAQKKKLKKKQKEKEKKAAAAAGGAEGAEGEAPAAAKGKGGKPVKVGAWCL